MIITIISFILILGLLVFVHELGHFIAAKKNGILVEEFGIGFPPRLFGIKKGETLYTINLLPLGGFVKVYGEEYHELATKDKIHKDRAFAYKKPWQKAIVIVAGVIGNFLLGWVLISFLFTQGVPVAINKVFVDSVQHSSPAEQAGLKKDDIISSLTPQSGSAIPLGTSSELATIIQKYGDKQVTLTYIRNGNTYETQLTPRKNPPPGQGSIGIVMITKFTERKYPWYQAPFYGLGHAFDITKTIVTELSKTIIQLVSLQKPQVDVTGPIGIARFTGQAIKFGHNAVLEFIALLSLNLAVVNILPFPALDGGRLVFIIYEWITKKRVNQAFERNLNLAGIVILLTLAVLISINDVIKIYK
ncbi:MAG: M50 family metallopeptidase [bacterium]|nr:M50 family metallopeptidase [bacterium]